MMGAFILHVSVAIVGGDKVSDKNTCGTAVGVVLTLNLLGVLLGWIPLIGFPIWVILWFVVIMGAYEVGFARACLLALVNLVVGVFVQLLLVAALGVTIFGFAALFG